MNTITEPAARPRLMLPEPTAARPTRAWVRLSWLAGIGLLTASLVGAEQVLHSRPTAEAPAERSFAGPPGVVLLGTVDLEYVPGGYVPLSPTQPGEVVEVNVREGQEVKKGDVLLRVDQEIPQQLVAQAETGVRLAEDLLAQAQQQADRYKAGVEAQQAAVDAAKHKITAAEIRLARQRRIQTIGQSNDEEINASTEDLNAAKSLAAAEEAKLRAMQANKPDAKIREATDNVTLARQRADQARLAVKRCSLEAPADGTIARLTIAKGAVLGPQSRQAPVLFTPAGPRVVRTEVPQEFAHRVQVGMAAVVQDEATGQMTWRGHVKERGTAFLPKRSAGGPESIGLTGSEERLLECLVVLDANQSLPLLGQRVRVNIGTHGGP
ncbi:MAG TPA: biotin/lipoyl-binding protein [Gemmataceae bacterium]|jgi:multidrug resistance efflux pump|nr:biotin/lipoyl-binding protein [Gemmataceae bacterium]